MLAAGSTCLLVRYVLLEGGDQSTQGSSPRRRTIKQRLRPRCGRKDAARHLKRFRLACNAAQYGGASHILVSAMRCSAVQYSIKAFSDSHNIRCSAMTFCFPHARCFFWDERLRTSTSSLSLFLSLSRLRKKFCSIWPTVPHSECSILMQRREMPVRYGNAGETVEAPTHDVAYSTRTRPSWVGELQVCTWLAFKKRCCPTPPTGTMTLAPPPHGFDRLEGERSWEYDGLFVISFFSVRSRRPGSESAQPGNSRVWCSVRSSVCARAAVNATSTVRVKAAQQRPQQRRPGPSAEAP
jgi:hypothetical protein